MSIFAFLGGRHNRRAWGQALFAAGCRLPEKPDAKRYARATDQLIRNDCRIIQECARILSKTRSASVKSQRSMIMFSRINHLARLEPYADRQQRKLIRETKAAAARARRQSR